MSLGYLILIFILLVGLAFSQLSPEKKDIQCSKHEFRCKDGLFCIPEHDLCDGFTDCYDMSDETILECANMRCPDSISFQCAYGGCIGAEYKCDGTPDCLDSSDEDLEICNYLRCPENLFQCANDKCIHTRLLCDNTDDCGDNSDEKFENCGLSGNCERPMKLKNGQFLLRNGSECLFEMNEGSDIDQRTGNSPQVCLEYICDEGYILDEFKSKYISRCIDGVWTPGTPSCVACGWNYRPTPLIFEPNIEVLHPEPWHVALFLYNITTNEHNYKCGGSVVHARAIISAAHCFMEFPYHKSIIPEKRAPLSHFKFALGKKWLNYTIKEKYLQILQIEDLRINSYNRFYGNDIAIIIVKEKIEFSLEIMPVCMDLSQAYTQFTSSSITGKVVGFGTTKRITKHNISIKTLSESLQAASFQICCGQLECVKQTSELCPGDVNFVTEDKFCVNILNKDTKLGQGDSGGGFVIQKKKRHYLIGVVRSSEDEVLDLECCLANKKTFCGELDLFNPC